MQHGYRHCTQCAGALMSASALRHRPIFGGVFGKGRYALATQPCISRGLHAVRYMVIDPSAGAVLSVSEDKLDALASARKLLRAADALAESTTRQVGEQAALWPTEVLPPLGGAGSRPRAVSRRRREVFGKSAGRCHYCGAGLSLEGKWHVEHMLPKALDGSDELVNLVAACVPCNLAKSDSTAIEFVSRLA